MQVTGERDAPATPLYEGSLERALTMTITTPSQRDPEPGETCSCGRDAVVVFRTAHFGDVASCRR